MTAKRLISIVLLGAFFIAAGANHFWHSAFYIRIVPPYLPNAAVLVAISGIAEIAGGVGVLVPRTRRIAGIGLIVLLVAVFPANIQMAMHPERYRDLGSPVAFNIRLLLQLPLIAWVWWTCCTQPTIASIARGSTGSDESV